MRQERRVGHSIVQTHVIHYHGSIDQVENQQKQRYLAFIDDAQKRLHHFFRSPRHLLLLCWFKDYGTGFQYLEQAGDPRKRSLVLLSPEHRNSDPSAVVLVARLAPHEAE